MVKVNVAGHGVVEISSDEYQGNIHEFLKKIFSKIRPGLTTEDYNNKYRGKWTLITLDGRLLSPGVRTRGHEELTSEQIKDIIEESSRLRLVIAPLPLRAKKNEEVIELEDKITQMKSDMLTTGIDKTKSITKAKDKIEQIMKKQPAFVFGKVKILPQLTLSLKPPTEKTKKWSLKINEGPYIQKSGKKKRKNTQKRKKRKNTRKKKQRTSKRK